MSDARQETLDDICQKIRDAGIPELADHILAAWKRERAEIEAQALSIGGIVESSRNKQKPQGNAAALLEALRALRDASRDFYNQILNSKYSGILDKYTCVKQGFPAVLDLRSAFPMANYALAAPQRNCDAMPWRKAWDEWRAKHHPQNPQTFNESYEATVAFMEWFTAPESEKGATA